LAVLAWLLAASAPAGKGVGGSWRRPRKRSQLLTPNSPNLLRVSVRLSGRVFR
jgi:hypothetical protein